tara:strand:+ start:183 stop:1202 length:1020 start_codon:yes stop_codon:yes gene_type:complete
MNFFHKKIIFLISKGNYRTNALGNFGKSQIYKNFIIISLSGKFKYLFGKLCNKFNLGKFISIDGTPFLTNEKNSINIWFGGTYMKIIKKFLQYENNYTNIINPAILNHEKHFDIYPNVKINKISFCKNRKIIFMGRFYFKPNNKYYFNEYRLHKIRSEVLNDFKIVENKIFWDEHLPNGDEKEKFDNYRIVKTYIRKEILKIINLKFHKKLYIYSDERMLSSDFQILEPIYDLSKIKKIYSGNICIDTGSLAGSVTFSPRAIQIFESGGILLQTWQQDSKKKLDIMFDDITCANIDQLLQKIDYLLRDDNKCRDFANKSSSFLLECENKLSKTLDNIFN